MLGGSNGEILVSADGGRTWTAQKLRTKAELVDVAFTDSLHRWAMGTESVSLEENRARTIVMSTVDGGLTWTRRYSHVGQAWGFALAVASAE